MKIIDKRMAVREILLKPKFMRLKQVSMAVDYRLDKDRKEDRYSHSIEVANATEIMNDFISERVGFKTDYRNTGYIVGLMHDIGHPSFGHEGAAVLDKLIRKASNNKIIFDDNSNNYVVIQKNQMLKDINEDDQKYILASLAKHPEAIYDDQDYILKIIEEELRKELIYLKDISKGKIVDLKKTLQCQIMDIADENSYIVSDIIDSLNIMNKESLAKAITDNIDIEYSPDIVESLFSSKNDFVTKMQDIFFMFCNNYIINNEGKVVYLDKKIEGLRKSLLKINITYVINSKKVRNIRFKNTEIMKKVANFFINEEYDIRLIPSTFYREEISLVETEEERLISIRNMLGAMTDKGIKKFYKKLS